jgi:hypothetical protein
VRVFIGCFVLLSFINGKKQEKEKKKGFLGQKQENKNKNQKL